LAVAENQNAEAFLNQAGQHVLVQEGLVALIVKNVMRSLRDLLHLLWLLAAKNKIQHWLAIVYLCILQAVQQDVFPE
jgi:hypothetical protein